jgi:ATP-dependent Lon protease
MMMPLFVGREKSINALEDAMSKQTDIVLAAQRDAKTNNPEPKDIYDVGTIGTAGSPQRRNHSGMEGRRGRHL